MLKLVLALSIALINCSVLSLAYADDDTPFMTWQNTTPSNVNQSAVISPSDTGLTIAIGIGGQNEGTSVSDESVRGVINESAQGPGRSSGPPFSLPALLPPTGGANVIVPGGPTSFETDGSGQPRSFGGQSIGGWNFLTPGTPGRTTPFAPIGPVPHIDAWNLAFQAEQEFPVPQISLKVNPDPGRVNVDSWFWVDGYDGSMITHSKTQHASHSECRLLNGVPDCQSVDDSVTVVVQALRLDVR